ncbi:hypothetical protein Zmor_012626 [Zophobas morio]|uniref:Uncharacterized protein n=1 Tax=Zophobas morio TaxID=2755281 RepID=A0AA38IBS5_9CUCU|nr:hypothetical protein Zmor_012626 [Zophobas morio]
MGLQSEIICLYGRTGGDGDPTVPALRAVYYQTDVRKNSGDKLGCGGGGGGGDRKPNYGLNYSKFIRNLLCVRNSWEQALWTLGGTELIHRICNDDINNKLRSTIFLKN